MGISIDDEKQRRRVCKSDTTKQFLWGETEMSLPFTNRVVPKSITFAIVGAALSVASSAQATMFNIYVSDYNTGQVFQVPDDFGGGTVGAGQLFASGFTNPYGIATKAGDVYMSSIGDTNVYRKASNAGGAGQGTLFATSTVTTIYAMTFADSGNLQVSGPSTNVEVFNPSGTSLGSYTITNQSAGITYVPGDGVYLSELTFFQRMTGSGNSYADATAPALAGVSLGGILEQLVMGPDGNLYVASYSTDKTVWRVNPTTGATTDLFPTSQITTDITRDINPVGVMVGPDGKLYFSDFESSLLYRTDLDGSNPAIVAQGFSKPAYLAFVEVPEPGAMGVLGLGAFALLVKRRRA